MYICHVYLYKSLRPGPGRSGAVSELSFQKHRVLPMFSRFLSHFAGHLALDKSSKTMRFIAFFAIFAFPRILMCSCSFFRKRCENIAFYRVFRAARLRFSVRFFVVFARSLCKKVLKTTRFRIFVSFPRPRHGPLVFSRPFRLAFLAFAETSQKQNVFARFFECGREPCGYF